MYCPNCGKRIADDSRFCSECGTNLKKAAATFRGMPYLEQTEQKPADSIRQKKEEKEPLPKTLHVPYSSEKDGYESGGRKPNFLIIGLILATFLASLIITVVIFSGVAKDSTAVIFLSDSKYGVIGDLESGTAIDLVGSKTDETIPNLQFCSDGKTIYFLTRYDGTSGNLNRTDYTKLRVTGTRNEDQIEQVASDVAAFEACGTEGVLFSTASRTLYYYDGQESTQIGKLVCHYQTDEKGRILYASGEGNDYTVYGALLSDPDNRQKLVAGLNSEAADALFEGETPLNFDNIPFLQEGSLYSAGFDRQPVLIAEHVKLGAAAAPGEEEPAAAYPRTTFLYLVANGRTFVRYDHLAEDPAAVKDTVLNPPEEKDYQTPVYETAPITDEAAAEADYPELYTSCTLAVSGLDGVSIGTAASMSGLPGSRTAVLAQEFVGKYKTLEDGDALIAITEDIKADLKKLADAAGKRNWLLFCFTKRQSGVELDQAAWDKAHANYHAVEERNRFRSQLKEEMSLYTLWFYNNGITTKLQDDVLFLTDPEGDESVRFVTGTTYQEWLEQKSFGALYDHGTETFQTDLEQKAVVLPAAAVVTIPANSLPVAGDVSQMKITVTENTAAALTKEGDLYLAAIKNRTVGEFVLEAQKAGLVPSADSSRLYYQANSYRVGVRRYADLFVFENGKSLCLGKELVHDSPVLFCDEGGMLACTDYQSGRGRELTLFTTNGDAKYIADGVTDYKWISQDEIVYLSDGDLYLYRRGSHIRLKNEVEQFWTNGKMEGHSLHFDVVVYN